jgi:hypothetical protein
MAATMLDPAIATLLALAYALLFGSAAAAKLRDLPAFAATVEAYALLPRSTQRAAALLIVLAEAAVAAGLASGVARMAAAAGGIALLTAYAGAIAINLRRGRRDLACGCGGPGERRPVSAWLVWRNAALATVLGCELLPPGVRPLGLLDGVTICGGVVTVALLYAGLDRLLGDIAPRAAALKASR